MNKLFKSIVASVFTMSTVLTSLVMPIGSVYAAEDEILGANSTGYMNENDLGGTLNIASVSKTTAGYTYEKLNAGLGGKASDDYYAHYHLAEGIGTNGNTNQKIQPYTPGGAKVWNGTRYVVASVDFYPVKGLGLITLYAGSKGSVFVLNNIASAIKADSWNNVTILYKAGYYSAYINGTCTNAWNETQDTTPTGYTGNIRVNFSPVGTSGEEFEIYLDNVSFKLSDSVPAGCTPLATIDEPTPTPTVAPTAKPTAAPTSDPDADLVVDSGFENASVGTTFNGSTPQQTGIYFTGNVNSAVVTDEKAATGAHSLKLIPNGEEKVWPGLNQYVSLKAGQLYCGSVDLYIGEEYGTLKSGDSYVRFTDLGSETTEAYAARGNASTSASKGKWVHMVTYYTPSQDYAKARINITMPQGYVLYVDNLSVKAIDAIPTPTPTPTPKPTPTPDPNATPTPTPTPEPAHKKVDVINNGSFEKVAVGYMYNDNGGVPAGSFATGNGSNVVTDEYAYDGNQSLKVIPKYSDDKSGFVGLNYGLTLEAGKKYYATAKVMIDPENTASVVGTSMYIRLWHSKSTASSNEWLERGTFDTAKAKEGWTEAHTGIFTADKAYSSADSMRLNITMLNGANSYIDDIHVYEVTDTIVDVTNMVMGDVLGNVDNTLTVLPNATVAFPYTNYLDAATISSSGVLLNGEKLDTSKVDFSFADDTVTLKLKGLEKGKLYTLTLSDGTWKDEYGVAFKPYTTKIKVSNDVYVGSLKLTDGSGNVAEGLLEAGTYTIKADNIKNTTASNASALILVVLYKDGKIADKVTKSISLSANEAVADASAQISVPSGSGYVLKAFVWDSIENAISLCDHVEME